MLYGGIEEIVKKKIVKILQVLFPDVKIYLYGSRARGNFRENSDIDLALDFGIKKERVRLGEAKSVLEGLHIPYKIDLVDLNFISEQMRQIIKKEGVLWSD